jgi:hypothetical protein
MTFVETSFIRPKSYSLINNKNNDLKLIIQGQGVFLFENPVNNFSCMFNIYDYKKQNGLRIELNETSVKINRLPDFIPLIDENNNQGLSDKKGAYYWLSVDSQNQRLYVGLGEARIENAIYEYIFSFNNDEERKNIKSFLESLVTICFSENNVFPLQLLRDPITKKIPLLIKNTQQLRMNHIANYKYLPSSHLSSTAQQLYYSISGKKFILDDKDFPHFSKAIEYSIATPGMWCYERLKAKSTEFDKDKPNILETYLRITLNQNNGESPGIPYVMEIWPIGHFSPIHNHGNAHAIIRVLHGKINVKLFPFLCDEPDTVDPFSEVQFVKNDITWISPTLNQVHQLTNLKTNKNTCVTIQCYMYDEKDKLHYDYFDYLDSKEQKQQYEPDSDMDFIQFKETMKQEWENRPKVINIINKKISLFFGQSKK